MAEVQEEPQSAKEVAAVKFAKATPYTISVHFFPLKPNPCHVAGSKDRKSKMKLLSQKGTTGGKEVAQGQQV